MKNIWVIKILTQDYNPVAGKWSKRLQFLMDKDTLRAIPDLSVLHCEIKSGDIN
jgi:hypothetical protein